MSYKIKTLIVFDTNSLRNTDAGEVAYSFFIFGRPFQVIEEFILEKTNWILRCILFSTRFRFQNH